MGIGSAARLVIADDCIVGDDRALESKEIASPIHNDIVTATCTEDVSTTSKPSKLTGTILICQEIAGLITVSADHVEEIGVSSCIKG